MKETLELVEKYGIKPLLLVAVIYLYSENNQNKQDIKEVQALLVDCYKQQVIRTASVNTDIINKECHPAILPNDIYTKRHIKRYTKA